MDVAAFVEKWSASGASERVNKDLFLAELCDVLGVPRPEPKLEAEKNPPEAVAKLLMRCIFTMFAEVESARRDGSEVDPAIFGTLLERALDPKERHELGAHYTHRAYIERLIRPTIEEPMREEWDNVQTAARKLYQDGKQREARGAVRAYHTKLCQTRVLDPACGTGNFLYVALDLFKRLESEVLALLSDLGERQERLHAEGIHVTPGQFLGIEVKPWAKEIAELVLWIGYRQWHFRAYGKLTPPPEPVLRDFRNIECRDAVLAWDREAYENPRKARWPDADFIVGNPPFVANRNMRSFFGDGYVDALRAAYPEIRDAADFVMYFWSRAAGSVGARRVRRAGLITTNSIRMVQNQGVVRQALASGCKLVFAIPDHPWPDDPTNAKVRISMTVVAHEEDASLPRLLLTPMHDRVARGQDRGAVVAASDLRAVDVSAISADLSPQRDVSALRDLRAAEQLDSAGMKPYATELVISSDVAHEILPDARARSRYAPRYRNGQDIGQSPRGVHVLDLFGLSEATLRATLPAVYQYVLTHVRPGRVMERNKRLRDEWWLFEANRPQLREAIKGLRRYIVTVENSPVRVFVFLDSDILPDQKLRVIASEDAFVLGVLSSRPHVVLANRLGGRQGVGNTPVYNTRCFTQFPFPAPPAKLVNRIRELGESLDAHRKQQRIAFPGLALTGMYNVLEKLRSGKSLTDKERVVHDQGLVSVLKQLHDDLDASVFEAYGWPADLKDEQILDKLVALNAERAAEEARGIVRWLRPEFQNPSGARAATTEG